MPTKSSGIPFRVWMPKEHAQALALVPRLTGNSKQSLVRRAIARELADLGLLDQDAAEQVPPTATTTPKETNP